MIARLISATLGIWLMAAPAVLGYGGAAETNDRIVGPMIATFAIVAISGVTRPLRWVNTALGVWLMFAPILLGYASPANIADPVVGAAVALLSLYRGKVEDRFGGGWSALWHDAELLDPERTD